MDFTEYRQRGKEMVDYIADYLENIRDRRVFPDVKPGYMKNLLPDSAPLEGEQWDAIFGDVERVIMPGITHWQSPHMHAYFPALNSFPSLLGDMLADAINCLGFTWASSPACTELEIIVMNWLGKMINLPDDFLHLNSSSRGGGVVQTTASEATLVCLLAGRTRAIQRFHEKRPGYQDAEINARLVAYCSDQAHSSVEKAALIGLVRMRYIEADENLSMRGQILREAIEDDIRQGLVPFWVCATLGTTGSCSFDNLEEIGIVCREFNLWLHVDAAYAGSAFICPEFRTWLKGIERADSIAFNPSKWLMIHFDATALWVKDSTAVHRTFNVEPLYLQHENSGVAIDYMHWQIPLSRRFRALKIWFVLRTFGIKGLQRHIREGVRLAQKFEALVLADHRFEIPAKRHLGLVVFRIKGENEITERLLKRLNHRGNLHCIPSSLKGKYVIRFTVTSTRTTVDDILRDWMEIKNSATAILDEMNITISNRVYLKDTKEKCEGFGSSLLLSNSPLSPKIVNGSFAALFDADEFLAKTYAGIRIAHQESPSMRRRVRGILMSGKQFSLDSHMDVVVQTSMNSHTSNSKMVDSYGKTTADSKNEDRNAICEDEEALEDCEMNWTLNTALQSNPINYLAVLNNQNSTPVDIIHRQNKLSSFLSKYATKYEVKNLTKSVNSVRTPLTQYQLYKNPRQSSITKEMQETVSPNLYPGKRYLNLDLTLHNDSIFTDTIFNLPTPTEEVIPIIITADTPTSSTKYIPDIEEPNKLHPLNSTVLLGASNNVDDFNKPLSSSSILIPIEETTEENNDLAKIVTLITTAKCNDLSKKDLCEIPSIPNYSSDSQELSEMNTPSRENIAATSSYISYTFSPKTFAKAWNDVQDLNKPLTSSSCLIPIAESIDETNDSSKIVSNFTNYISIETNVEDLSKFQLPIATFTTNLTSSSKSQKLVTTSSSIQNMNYISNSKTPNVDEELRELNGRKNMSTSILSTFLSNQKSFSDYLDRKESENETPTISNYFFTPNIVEGNNIEPTKSSTIISNIQFSNDSEDSPQFPMICSEDLSAASSNKNSIKCPIEIEKYTNNQSPKSSIVDESYSVFDEFNKLCNIPPVKSLTFADFSIFNKVSTENNIQPSKSLSIIEDPLLFKELHEDISISSTVDETSVNFNYLFSTKSPTEIVESATNIQLPTFLQVEGNYSVSEELNKQCSIQPTKSLTFTDFSMLKEISAESNIQPSNTLTVIENTSFFKEFSTEDENSLNFKDRTNENCMQTPKSSIEEVAAPTFVKQLYKEMYPKILNSKSKDNSSSSDEFLESVRQPSNDSEVLSSASSSLDIM